MFEPDLIGSCKMMQAENIDKYQRKYLINWRIHLLVFMIAFAIITSRRPDALLNAQFWAEDGRVWYAEAYSLGVMPSLFVLHTGYFQTASRLTAGIAQFFPFIWAPLIFNLTAILIMILPVNLLVSSRFALLIPNFYYRLFIGALYLALPNSFEVHANITNSHWYLAILACMVFLATPSTILIWQLFDVGIIVVSGLSGPFSIMLVPIATIIWFVRRKKFLLILVAFLYTGALVQALAIYNGRHHILLGATPALFTKITGQLFLGALLGQKGLEWLTVHFWGYELLLVLTATAGITAFLYSFLKAPLELQMFNCLATLVFFASLLSPVESGTIPAWVSLSTIGFGCRY